MPRYAYMCTNATVALPTLQGMSERATIQGWGGIEDVPWIDIYLVCQVF